MDFLKAEIERKRKQISQSNVLLPDKKYFKRGDLHKKQEDDYWRKRMPPEEPKQSEASTSAAQTSKQKKIKDKLAQLPRKEVIRRLRERNEPITLFAETDMESYQRLKKLESTMPEVNKGFKNDLKAAMDQVDQDYIDEIIKQTGGEDVKAKNTDVSVKDDGTTRDDIPGMRDELGQGDTNRDHEHILSFLKLVLRLWGERLNEREPEVKRSQKGKMASAIHTQTVEYLKPLFKKLKNKEIDHDILDSMTVIVKHLMDRNYIKASDTYLEMAIGNSLWPIGVTMANDTYLEMAIGNSPWPIGVTMVGIHARTGREKISSKYVAHVLNDETQRKYIQALKRLMTQSQILFPTDPIRSVEYQRPDKIT